MVAMRQHRSRQRTGRVRIRMNGQPKNSSQSRETTPTPPLKRRGFRALLVAENTLVILNSFQDPARSNPVDQAKRMEVLNQVQDDEQ